MSFLKISPTDLTENTFDLINRRWMLLTAGDETRFNPMTVSWGGFGVLWRKPVAACFVRPQRYTYEIIEGTEYYTLSIYPDSMKDIHGVCGSKSGRDIDKAKECGLTPVFCDCGATYFEEAELVFVCRKMYCSDFNPSRFIDPSIEDLYPDKDYHRAYIGEIVEILKKD